MRITLSLVRTPINWAHVAARGKQNQRRRDYIFCIAVALFISGSILALSSYENLQHERVVALAAPSAFDAARGP